MNFLKDNLDNIFKGIVLLFLAIIISISSFLLVKQLNDDGISKETTSVLTNNIETINEENEESNEVNCFYIDIKGAVKKPDVYQVCDYNIVNDVITMAGGLKSTASTKYLNLSKRLEAEMIIYIYTKTEVTKLEKENVVVEQECNCTLNNVSDCVNSGSSIIVTDQENIDSSESVEEKISINEASKEELMNLNGIGDAKATAIIEYRTKNGSFKSLEEIKNVSGISDSLYEKIKDYIKL